MVVWVEVVEDIDHHVPGVDGLLEVRRDALKLDGPIGGWSVGEDGLVWMEGWMVSDG